VAAPLEACLKLRQSSRVLLAHNLFVGWAGALAYGSERMLNFQSSNNTVDHGNRRICLGEW
jgi:hypothetical protein